MLLFACAEECPATALKVHGEGVAGITGADAELMIGLIALSGLASTSLFSMLLRGVVAGGIGKLLLELLPLLLRPVLPKVSMGVPCCAASAMFIFPGCALTIPLCWG